MLFTEIYLIATSQLIYVMGAMLLVALIFRFLAWRSQKKDALYYRSLSRHLEQYLEHDKVELTPSNMEGWLKTMFKTIMAKLPNRSVRTRPPKKDDRQLGAKAAKVESISEYMSEGRVLLYAVIQNIDAFKSSHRPNFDDLTSRVLRHDKRWSHVMGVVPVDMLTRLLDILPGLFIVGGILGTFVGITTALPQIGNIDMENLDKAGPVITSFVDNVSYAMNTSIAGIIFSVIMTTLNAMFPLSVIRSGVRRSLAVTFESLWFRIHGGRITAGEEKIIHLLVEIRDAARKAPSEPEKKDKDPLLA